MSSGSDVLKRLEVLNEIGISLSSEKNTNRLLENILLAAKKITRADAGTLYLIENNVLKFEIIRTDSLQIAMGGMTGETIPFPPIPLHDESGQPNDKMVVAYAVLHDQTVNIADAYHEAGFDFSGTRAFDRKTGYRSKSFLTVPMKNHENEIIGLLQLINAIDPASGEILAFSNTDQRLVESLASQAAISLTNRLLMQQLEDLFESFITLINHAIDEKSPYTGGHCQRVPELTMLLADAVNDCQEGALAEFKMSEKDRYELRIAGLLHDCGKVTTPVHIVDKATKLDGLFDRVHLIDTRFEVLKRDAEIALLKAQFAETPEGRGRLEKVALALASEVQVLEEERAFIRHSNIGGEFMKPEAQQRVASIGQRAWCNPDGEIEAFLSQNELENLCIAKGTLTEEERQVINHHIVATLEMLEALKWPKHLRNVPEYAGGHHERMDGKGYPNGLLREQMSIQARIMAIADIFEALTAKDRPYKVAKPLSEALTILGRMKLDNHIDPDLFDVFIREKVYLKYADAFLDEVQIDEVDQTKIPGYIP